MHSDGGPQSPYCAEQLGRCTKRQLEEAVAAARPRYQGSAAWFKHLDMDLDMRLDMDLPCMDGSIWMLLIRQF